MYSDKYLPCYGIIHYLFAGVCVYLSTLRLEMIKYARRYQTTTKIQSQYKRFDNEFLFLGIFPIFI